MVKTMNRKNNLCLLLASLLITSFLLLSCSKDDELNINSEKGFIELITSSSWVHENFYSEEYPTFYWIDTSSEPIKYCNCYTFYKDGTYSFKSGTTSGGEQTTTGEYTVYNKENGTYSLEMTSDRAVDGRKIYLCSVQDISLNNRKIKGIKLFYDTTKYGYLIKVSPEWMFVTQKDW